MNEDAGFLEAIRAAPKDNLSRLVYADWLDEQGRPGGDFLRVECEIADLDPAEFNRREQIRVEAHASGVIDFSPPNNISDTYDRQRTNLIAQSRSTIRGLDDTWMEAVSRVPITEINARVREIQSWLNKRQTIDELITMAASWDKFSEPPRTFWQRVRGMFHRNPEAPDVHSEGPRAHEMREWLEKYFQPGDELWKYDTGGETWSQMCGEMGYAIVRNGKVVEFEMIMMN